jgi:hypothetical protein
MLVNRVVVTHWRSLHDCNVFSDSGCKAELFKIIIWLVIMEKFM